MALHQPETTAPTIAAASCDRRGADNICPISKKICPGVCIYEQILANITVGILVFDIAKKEVVFSNHEADRILDDLCPTKDFAALQACLFPDLEELRGTREPPARSLKHEVSARKASVERRLVDDGTSAGVRAAEQWTIAHGDDLLVATAYADEVLGGVRLEWDAFNTGHSGTSISAGGGLNEAKYHLGGD